MKTPLSYYGGKQNLAAKILQMIPKHNTYVEPFIGGGAVFFLKERSEVEVINDTNKQLINFYRVAQNDFTALESEVRISLHSRDLHRKAKVIYNNPDMFPELKQAWAIWVLATQSFSSMLDGSFGYDVVKGTTSKKIHNKRTGFTEEIAIRLQRVQIECTDALRIINSRDTKQTFFYCDPPYYNSDMGHYDGYSIDDYEALLKTLSLIQGKFLLSSYPSKILTEYKKANNWKQEEKEMKVSVANNSGQPPKTKVEVFTANYDFTKLSLS